MALGLPTLCSLDKTDGRKEIVTGYATPNHSNFLVFQWAFQPKRGLEEIVNIELNHLAVKKITSYFIGNMSSPPLFSGNLANQKYNLIEELFDKDLSWAIADALRQTKLYLYSVILILAFN